MEVRFRTNLTLIIAENYMQTGMSAKINMWGFLMVCFQPDIALKITHYK